VRLIEDEPPLVPKVKPARRRIRVDVATEFLHVDLIGHVSDFATDSPSGFRPTIADANVKQDLF
jgi:hypothetical protein